MRNVLALIALIGLVPGHASADDSEMIRERRNVAINGVAEEWLLKWTGPVKPACGAADLPQASTCPCSGFAYGEQGQLLLERKRGGTTVETMKLAPLFAESESPGDSGNAVLRRWPRNDNDPFDEIDDQDRKRTFDSELMLRPPAEVMDMRDFARDGANSAFLLQVGAQPCGKHIMVLVGVSRSDPALHAFATVAHPERPLMLQAHEWKAILKSSGQVTVTDWSCGDHGSDTETEKTISAYQGRFKVTESTYTCKADGTRGALIRSEED
jgi:hypothetical protein